MCAGATLFPLHGDDADYLYEGTTERENPERLALTGLRDSSLSYLVALPVQAVKIDRSFVTQMSSGRQARAVVASILSMSRELGLHTVAEGVETAEQAELLRALGCEEAQGYFFGRPVPAEELERQLGSR